jgi:hypothetical protein
MKGASKPRIERWSALMRSVRSWSWSPMPVLDQLANALEQECKHIDELERRLAEMKAREGTTL